MLRVLNEDLVWGPHPPSGVTLVGAETALLVGGPGFSAGASYVRPVRVERPGDGPVPIRDHLMIARLAVAAMVLIATVWRVLRD
jgi:hypothetical protein